jgi:methenyltetrahydrofolate cyclohydrolase
MSQPFLEQLAEPRPFPGGGSAAAYVGALALALVEKVVRLEIKRSEADSPGTEVWNGMLSRVSNISARFRFLTQEDGRAYARMARLRAHGFETDVTLEAVREAAMAPVQMIHAAIQGLKLISESVRECREYLVPDLQVSVELLSAGATRIELATSGVKGRLTPH